MGAAIVLLAHGARNDKAAPLLRQQAELVAARTGVQVAIAFREFIPPTLAEAVRRCREGGASRIVVMPYFLLPGAHVTRDLPAEMAALRAAFPGLELALAAPLGVHPGLAEVVAERVSACCAEHGWILDPSDPV